MFDDGDFFFTQVFFIPIVIMFSMIVGCIQSLLAKNLLNHMLYIIVK